VEYTFCEKPLDLLCACPNLMVLLDLVADNKLLNLFTYFP